MSVISSALSMNLPRNYVISIQLEFLYSLASVVFEEVPHLQAPDYLTVMIKQSMVSVLGQS